MPELIDVRFTDLTTTQLHAILKLRNDVFVVEQASPYNDIDGRDTEPGTRHLWLDHHGEPLSYLRLLSEPDGAVRVGRVVTPRHARGKGHAGRLMRAVVGSTRGAMVLDAQTHLVPWYEEFGFRASGPEFDDGGISHIPMRRPATRTRRSGPAPAQRSTA